MRFAEDDRALEHTALCDDLGMVMQIGLLRPAETPRHERIRGDGLGLTQVDTRGVLLTWAEDGEVVVKAGRKLTP
jgi:hypothetical protein